MLNVSVLFNSKLAGLPLSGGYLAIFAVDYHRVKESHQLDALFFAVYFELLGFDILLRGMDEALLIRINPVRFHFLVSRWLIKCLSTVGIFRNALAAIINMIVPA